MTPFEQARSALTDAQRVVIDGWAAAAAGIAGGNDVVLNVKEENQLDEPVFREVLKSMASAYQAALAAGSNPKNAETSYSTVCRESKFHFKGTDAKVSERTVLHSVLNKPTLGKLLQNVTGYGSEDDAWNAFWGPANTDEDRLEMLTGVQPFDGRKEIVWTYFDPAAGEAGSEADPLAGQNADATCRTLGLPTEWYPYKEGQHLYKFRYVVSNGGLKRHLPCTMDANAKGWNPHFQPAPEPRGVGTWGWTRPLGKARGEKGVPEVIHSALGKVAFHAIPDDLGVRTT